MGSKNSNHVLPENREKRNKLKTHKEKKGNEKIINLLPRKSRKEKENSKKKETEKKKRNKKAEKESTNGPNHVRETLRVRGR